LKAEFAWAFRRGGKLESFLGHPGAIFEIFLGESPFDLAGGGNAEARGGGDRLA